MQISVIAHLVQTQEPASLRAAEAALLKYQQPRFAVAGADVCEQLTHVLVAQTVQHHMREHDVSLPMALRAFAWRVRACISSAENPR